MWISSVPNPVDKVLPQVMNLSAVPDGYKATYDQEDSTGNKSGSTNTTSWSFSPKQSTSGWLTFGNPEEGSGLKIKDTFKAAQENLKGSQEHAHGKSQRQTFNLSATTGFSDEVFYLNSDFNIWVYPVIGKTVCPARPPRSQIVRKPKEFSLTVEFSAPNGNALTKVTQGQALQWYQPPLGTWQHLLLSGESRAGTEDLSELGPAHERRCGVRHRLKHGNRRELAGPPRRKTASRQVLTITILTRMTPPSLELWGLRVLIRLKEALLKLDLGGSDGISRPEQKY